MFEGLKGMAGIASLMKDLPQMKARLEEVKEQLGEITVQAETGGGAVRVVASCNLRIVSLHVDETMIRTLVDSNNSDDRTMAEDLISGAVNAALEKAQQRAAEELASVAKDMNLPIPPGGLGGLLG